MAPSDVRPNASSTDGSLHSDNEKLSGSTSGSSQESLNSQLKKKVRSEKADAIRHACKSRDLEALAAHGISEGGFLEDELRQMACKDFYYHTIHYEIY